MCHFYSDLHRMLISIPSFLKIKSKILDQLKIVFFSYFVIAVTSHVQVELEIQISYHILLPHLQGSLPTRLNEIDHSLYIYKNMNSNSKAPLIVKVRPKPL